MLWTKVDDYASATMEQYTLYAEIITILESRTSIHLLDRTQ
jgi:hypothetical protein